MVAVIVADVALIAAGAAAAFVCLEAHAAVMCSECYCGCCQLLMIGSAYVAI